MRLLAHVVCVVLMAAGPGLAATTGFTLDKSLPERDSPAIIAIDAGFLRTQKPGTWARVPWTPSFHCAGAVLTEIDVNEMRFAGSHARLYLYFYVGLRRGYDMDGTVEIALLDGERVIGAGRTRKTNLDEHAVTALDGYIRLTKKDLDALLAEGTSPRIRVMMTIDEQP